jgi:hypothetical protein
MAEVQTSEVDAKPAPVSLGLSRVKFGNRCWATKEFIVVKQSISLLEPTVEQRCDLSLSIAAQQRNLETSEQQPTEGIV